MNKIEKDFNIERVENTPFTLFTKDGVTKIAIGNLIASADVYENLEDAIKRVNSSDWDLITSVIYYLIKNLKTLDENENS